MLWTFILKFLDKKGDMIDVSSLDRAAPVEASKRVHRSITSLSPHEMSKWARKMFVASGPAFFGFFFLFFVFWRVLGTTHSGTRALGHHVDV